MKTFIGFLTILTLFFQLSSSFALAEEVKFQGFIRKQGSETLLIPDTQGPQLILYSSEPQMRSTIEKLSDGDFATGVATSLVGTRLVVDSIDFVGLKKILGMWKASKTIFSFKSFNLLSVLDVKDADPFFKNWQDFRYSVSPSEGQSWKVFIANKNSVALGTLEINPSFVILTIYDSHSGQVTNRFRLEKLQNQ